MVMSSQQRADILLAHWRNLWPLAPAERMKRIDEITADHDYEHLLGEIAIAVQEPEPEVIQPEPSTLIQFAAIALFIGCCLGLCIIAATPMPVPA